MNGMGDVEGLNGMNGGSGLREMEMDGMTDMNGYDYPQAGPSSTPLHHHSDNQSSIMFLQASGNTPGPVPKKRGRPPKNRTPDIYGQSFASPQPSAPRPRGRPPGSINRPRPSQTPGKSRSKLNGKVSTPLAGHSSDTIQAQITVVDDHCSFCEGGVENNRDNVPESMVCCTMCGRSGHYSCLDFKTGEIKSKVLQYDWTCMDCKTCEDCKVLGEEVSQLFLEHSRESWRPTGVGFALTQGIDDDLRWV